MQQKASLIFVVLLFFGSIYAFAKAPTRNILFSHTTNVPCAPLSTPANGQTNVPVESVITWDPEPGAVGYRLTLGTSPGGNDILDDLPITNNSYTPPTGLPENSTIYVNIGVRFDAGSPDADPCDEQSFSTETITVAPSCTSILSPSDGETGVLLQPTITWSYAPKATSYELLIGTSPGASDVLSQGNITTLSFTVPTPLNELTLYYARVIARNNIGTTAACTEVSFTTQEINDDIPDCTQLIRPADGAVNVPFTPILEWTPVANATRYLVQIGTTPNDFDVLNTFFPASTTSTAVIDFDPDTTYYVRVIPYNINVPAINCFQTSFSTSLGCGPYLDPDTGAVVDFTPQIDLEEAYTLCTNEGELLLEHTGAGTQFRWVQLLENAEREIGNERTISITESGTYRFEVIDEIPQSDNNFLFCENSFTFTVNVSEAATITGIEIRNQSINSRIIISIEGSGDYDFAINEEGPYQTSNIFNNVDLSNLTVYVRDRGGCGIVSQQIQRDLGFPKYFTPNNDGINDYWQVRGVKVDGETITELQVFDRFGKLLASFSPFGLGWDGTYNGEPLFDGNFWFQAFTNGPRVFKGYFALRRE